MYGNNIDAFNLSQLLMPGRDPAKDWGFFAGSIFWAKVALLEPLLDLEAHLEQASDSSHVTGEFSSVWHATERVFGLLSETAGKEVALAYSVNLDACDVEILLAKESRIPKGSPYSIGASISGCLKLESDRDLLVKTPGFDREFYLSHYSFLESWGVDSLYHYLRYGVYERCNPNDRFSSAWYWEENRDVSRVNINPLVHYTTHGFSEGRSSFPAEENTGLIRSIIDKPGIFSRSAYLERYPDVAKAKIDPLVHYSKFGWAEKRQPAASNNIFDHFWYNDEYLRHWRHPIDPLLHYIICERRRVVYPVPSGLTMEPMNEGHRFPDNATPRRICLFAGYDPQGMVDECVVDFITELNKHADVYYLCDANLFPQELSKLEGITKGAWGIRHGEYDFGSYSRLAHDLVGWEKIREYDELLLVNDSSYLIDSLDYVFSKMDGKSCDWWALQATKGMSATKDEVSNQFSEKVPFDYVIDFMLPSFEEDEVYDFHLGSYFLGFRVPLLQEGSELRKMLDSVGKERNKKNIIIRYEIGLTRRLMQKGSRPATFIDSLYPFHPIFTEYHFDLIREGFPLFKRFFLTENHYHVPQLNRWKSWIKEILPDVDLSAAEANLLRTSNAEKLYRTLNVPADSRKWPLPLMTDRHFRAQDRRAKVDANCWVFPVCGFDHTFGGNDRMVFEAVKNDRNIRKVILTRSKHIAVEGVNTEIYPLKSIQGQRALIQAKYIFVKHTPWRNAYYPLTEKKHRFINLWHGIPLKRIGYASKDTAGYLDAIGEQHRKCHAVIASSKVDRLAMAAGFYPLSFKDVWVTGLPRNDLIIREESRLPNDHRAKLAQLRDDVGERKLVLFAPTFRNGQKNAYYQFNNEEINQLAQSLKSHNAVIGIREHMADKAKSYSDALIGKDIPVLNLNSNYYPDIELIYREADLLITDYSSCFIDFMLTDKPEICFAFDYDNYTKNERGLFYELEDVFPGPICKDFSSLVNALNMALSGIELEPRVSYLFKKKMFFSYTDDNNSARVVAHVKGKTKDVVK